MVCVIVRGFCPGGDALPVTSIAPQVHSISVKGRDRTCGDHTTRGSHAWEARALAG